MSSNPPLDATAVSSLVAAATQYWSNLLGSDKVAALAGARVVTADLADSMLGDTAGSVVYLDADAAGFGWYVAGSVVYAGQIDALTVVEHELGHVLGYADDDPVSAVMREAFAPRSAPPPPSARVVPRAAVQILSGSGADAKPEGVTSSSALGRLLSGPAQRVHPGHATRTRAARHRIGTFHVLATKPFTN